MEDSDKQARKEMWKDEFTEGAEELNYEVLEEISNNSTYKGKKLKMSKAIVGSLGSKEEHLTYFLEELEVKDERIIGWVKRGYHPEWLSSSPQQTSAPNNKSARSPFEHLSCASGACSPPPSLGPSSARIG